MKSIKMAKEVVVWETLSDLSLISAHHLPRSQSYLLWETFPRWNWCSPIIRILRMVCTVQGVMPSIGLLCLTFYLPFLSVCVFVHTCVFYLVVCLTFVAVVVGDLSQSVWVLSLRLFTSSDTIFASCEFWRKPEACTHQMQPNSDSQFCASNPPCRWFQVWRAELPLPTWVYLLSRTVTTNDQKLGGPLKTMAVLISHSLGAFQS